MSADNSVGYMRPPTATRFKPGQSGNPGGRPKGSKNLKTLFSDMLNRKITVRIGDKKKRITQAEAIFQVAINKAAVGDSKALNTIVTITRSLEIFNPNPPEPGPSGVIIVPGIQSVEEWEKFAREQQAPYAGNEKNLT
jgi:uncharacterized protein DUF5681